MVDAKAGAVKQLHPRHGVERVQPATVDVRDPDSPAGNDRGTKGLRAARVPVWSRARGVTGAERRRRRIRT